MVSCPPCQTAAMFAPSCLVNCVFASVPGVCVPRCVCLRRSVRRCRTDNHVLCLWIFCLKMHRKRHVFVSLCMQSPLHFRIGRVFWAEADICAKWRMVRSRWPAGAISASIRIHNASQLAPLGGGVMRLASGVGRWVGQGLSDGSPKGVVRPGLPAVVLSSAQRHDIAYDALHRSTQRRTSMGSLVGLCIDSN